MWCENPPHWRQWQVWACLMILSSCVCVNHPGHHPCVRWSPPHADRPGHRLWNLWLQRDLRDPSLCFAIVAAMKDSSFSPAVRCENVKAVEALSAWVGTIWSSPPPLPPWSSGVGLWPEISPWAILYRKFGFNIKWCARSWHRPLACRDLDWRVAARHVDFEKMGDFVQPRVTYF